MFSYLQALLILKQLPTVIDIEVPADNHITVCGDVHGQFYDLLNIFKLNGLPSPSNPYLFNGIIPSDDHIAFTQYLLSRCIESCSESQDARC